MKNNRHQLWIEQKLDDNNYDTKAVYALYEDFNNEFPNVYSNSESYSRSVRVCKSRMLLNMTPEESNDENDLSGLLGVKPVNNTNKSINDLVENGVSIDIIKENIKLKKKVQALEDSNRTERASWRQYARQDNTVEGIGVEILSFLKNGFDLSVGDYKFDNHEPIVIDDKQVGVLQISDLHFNEVIRSVLKNEYDFSIASRRLKLLVEKSKMYFKAFGVKKVIVAMTGDLFNNNKIKDKAINQEYNRSYALLLGSYLLENVIYDLLEDFQVTVSAVVGNEARIDEDYGFTEKLLTDNLDFCCYHILKIMFRNVMGVYFADGKYDEKIINIMGTNILLLHGNTVSTTDNHKNIQNIIGKYSQSDLKVDFVIYGHIHSCNISDSFARSSSLCGSNNYSNNGLQLYGRASQNIHIIYSNGNRDSIKVDLQNISEIQGYNLDKKLIKEMNSKMVELDDVLVYV